MRRAFIYLLHFDVPLSHAEHYSGSTERLMARLHAHATGAGSRICEVLMERGIHWRLAALGECCHAELRRIERQLKTQHNGPRYCPICSQEPLRVPGTTPYPIEAVPFPTDSLSLSKGMRRGTSVVSRLFQPSREEYRELMVLGNAEKDAIGFVPACGTGGLAKAQLTIAKQQNAIVGYAAYTGTKENTTIHQATVEDGHRLCGTGRRIVEMIRSSHPERTTTARVRDDLAANHFWRSIGFEVVGNDVHKTSQSNITIYRAPTLRRTNEAV